MQISASWYKVAWFHWAVNAPLVYDFMKSCVNLPESKILIGMLKWRMQHEKKWRVQCTFSQGYLVDNERMRPVGYIPGLWVLFNAFTPLVSSHFTPIDRIRALMIVWRLGGKIIRTVLCCIVYDRCAQWYAHTCEQFLNLHVGLGLDFVFWCLFMFTVLHVLH